MSFDISRLLFDPTRDYLGVVMQQGRVQLDSDWNEHLMELLRRLQAGTMDLTGRSGVPATTPNGFKINAFSVGANPHLSIGCGRIYVDGLLAENHGATAQFQWDPALGEFSAAPQLPNVTEVDVDYTQQPYLPGASFSSAQVTGKQFLVYLDVWQRDVTAVQDSVLIDPAVGVDTTARRQTIWQVKLLDVSGLGFTAATPDAPIPGRQTIDGAIAPWAGLLQPSGGLLTVSTGGAQIASPSACALSPTTGYTGLENQLYRVEIHQVTPATGTTAASASFKWSRENGSVVTLVTAIATLATNGASQLTVQTLGRDQVLGFNPGDWVEVIDDVLELNGQPGELHLIKAIDPQNKTITLDSAVSVSNFPVSANLTDASRHTRIRRWDQTGAIYFSDGSAIITNLESADASGILAGTRGIPVPPSGTSLILESGITVAFDVAASGGFFEPGDFWTFAARTADSSIQTLTGAAPQGPHHHYARLATVDFASSPPTVLDCRRPIPSLASPALHVANVIVGGATLANDATITVQSLITNGISIVCDAPLDAAIITHPNQIARGAAAGALPTTQPNNPICIVSLDLPSAPNGGAFTRVTLPSVVSVSSTTLQWKAAISAAALTLLENQIPLSGPSVLARLTLKGSAVWAAANPSIFLNGANNGRPSADFEMWFWLISQPVATLNLASLQFAPQAINTASAPLTFTLTNNGATPLSVTAISVPTSFTQTNNIPTPVAGQPPALPPGGVGLFSVIFDPSAAGPASGQLSITESDPNTSPLTVFLSGTGIAPSLAASVASLVFPTNTIVGTTTAAQTIRLTSNGSSQVTISNIALIPPAGATFFINYFPLSNIPAMPFALQSQAFADIQVSFQPPAGSLPGTFSAQLSITHSAPGSPLNIPITAGSIAGTPVLTPSTTQLAFGTIVVGVTSTLSVTVTNSGNAVLNITGLPISGAQATAFTLGATPASLQPGQSASFTVSFRAAAVGLASALLQITSNSAGGTVSISLSGTGRAAKVSKEGKELVNDKNTVVEKKLTVLENKVIATERLAQARPALLGAQPLAAEASPAATQHSFITPEERPQLGPQEPEPQTPEPKEPTE